MRLELLVALRRLARAPGFTAGAVLLLAAGIGATTALGSVARTIVLAPLAYDRPESLVWVWSTRVDRDRAFFSLPNFRDTRARARTIADLAGFAPLGVNLGGAGDAVRVAGARTTANAFLLLGARAAHGRVLLPADDAADSSRVVLLGHGLWSRQLGGDPAVVGRTLELDGEPHVVAGVLAPGFVFPGAPDAELFVPLTPGRDPRRDDRGANSLRVFARLAPGATPAQARDDLARVTAELRAEFPVENGKHRDPRVTPLRDELVGEHGRVLGLVFAAVALLFVIACLNLAGLLVARALARGRELAIRAALGATRGRLILTLATEALLLALAGGAAGTLLAVWGVAALVRLAPAGTPRLGEVGVDGWLLAGALLATIVAALIFGTAPALHARRPGAGRAGRVLVVGQVATALLLVAATLALLGQVNALESTDPGFEPRGLVTARLSLPRARATEPRDVAQLWRRWQQAGAVAATNVLPLAGLNVRSDYSVVGRPPASAADLPAAQTRWVSPGYLGVMGIRLRRGRDLRPGDDAAAPRVVVVDETIARRHFGDGDPLGARLHIGDGPLEHEAEIVGVAATVAHAALGEAPTATLYEPLLQLHAGAIPFFVAGVNVVARGVEPAALRAALARVDPSVPASTARPVSDLLADSLAPARFQLRLVAAFALAAFALAALGVHALVAHEMARRRRELAIRRALGATGRRIAGDVVARALRLALAGGLAGAALTLPASLWLELPVWVVLLAAALLVGAAALASLVPALRAARAADEVLAMFAAAD